MEFFTAYYKGYPYPICLNGVDEDILEKLLCSGRLAGVLSKEKYLESRQALRVWERKPRILCPRCGGSGKERDRHVFCLLCDGEGQSLLERTPIRCESEEPNGVCSLYTEGDKEGHDCRRAFLISWEKGLTSGCAYGRAHDWSSEEVGDVPKD